MFWAYIEKMSSLGAPALKPPISNNLSQEEVLGCGGGMIVPTWNSSSYFRDNLLKFGYLSMQKGINNWKKIVCNHISCDNPLQ